MVCVWCVCGAWQVELFGKHTTECLHSRLPELRRQGMAHVSGPQTHTDTHTHTHTQTHRHTHTHTDTMTRNGSADAWAWRRVL